MMMLSFFRVEGFGELEIAVLVGEMRQQIGNGEHGFVFVFAEADADDFAVGFHDDAVNGQRTGKPLILAQAAVVVGFGLSHAHLFHERMLLEVEAGAVGVGADEADALGKRLAASAGHENGLAVQCLPALAGAEAFPCIRRLSDGRSRRPRLRVRFCSRK